MKDEGGIDSHGSLINEPHFGLRIKCLVYYGALKTAVPCSKSWQPFRHLLLCLMLTADDVYYQAASATWGVEKLP